MNLCQIPHKEKGRNTERKYSKILIIFESESGAEYECKPQPVLI